MSYIRTYPTKEKNGRGKLMSAITMFTEIVEKYTAALNWLQLNKIKIKGRYQDYLRKLKGHINQFVNNEGILKSEYLDTFKEILFNITELICIYEAFRHTNVNDEFKLKMNFCRKGTPLLEDENENNNAARNYQFELFMSSIFKKNDINVVFSNIADSILIFDEFTCQIECKRVRSIKGFKDEIKDVMKKSAIISNPVVLAVNITPMISNSVIVIKNDMESQNKMEMLLGQEYLNSLKIPDNVLEIFYIGNFIKIESNKISTPYQIMRQYKNNGKYENEKKLIRNAFTV